MKDKDIVDFGQRGRYHNSNRLNDLTTKEWLKFQKSWFIHNPPPRGKDVLLHPAKFPETLVKEFIEFFTKKGQTVFDPMAGTGSTLISAAESGRNGIGIELMPKYYEIAQKRIRSILDQKKLDYFDKEKKEIFLEIFCEDANNITKLKLPLVDYVITSPPYWNMLNEAGFETQKIRSEKGLDVNYSNDLKDLGNIENYEMFLKSLAEIYDKVYDTVKVGGYMTVIVKNVKKKGTIYPLAWDIAKAISKPTGRWVLKDEKIWCQDNQSLAPFGYRYVWVSNTFHHYCLNFKKEGEFLKSV